MSPQEEPLEELPVEMEETRPYIVSLPFVGGIPIGMASLLFLVFGEAAMLIKDWRVVVIAAVAWKFTSWALSYDYHALTLFQRYLRTSFWTLDDRARGGCGISTLPLRPRRPKGM